MAEKFSLSPELMREFDICFMPLSNPDGAFLGRTYHNSVPGDPDGPGYNILMDYKDEKHPETQNIGRYADSFKPHVFLRLHNGRHRKAFDIWLSEEYLSPPITEELRKSMSVEIAAFHPLSSKKEMLYERHSVPIVMVFETLLLKKNPGCDNFKDSYIKTGEDILGGLTNALRRMRSALLETQK
jgi:hypothetical protein